MIDQNTIDQDAFDADADDKGAGGPGTGARAAVERAGALGARRRRSSASASEGGFVGEGGSTSPFEPRETADTFATLPIGAYLRQQRELRAMSIGELASRTRIPLRSLERLESGQFDGETDGFVRGFVRTVASALGLDPEDTVLRMLQEAAPSAWERHGAGRTIKQAVAISVFACILVIGFLVLRTGWSVLVGGDSTQASRDIILWQDPVRALAESTGARLDPAGEIEPRRGGRGAPAGSFAPGTELSPRSVSSPARPPERR